MSGWIDLLQACERGEVSRRVFLERATQLAVGPVVAAPLDMTASVSASTQHPVAQTDGPESVLARADDVRSTAITRHGAYLCLDLPPATARAATTAIADLIQRLDFRNEFDAPHAPSDRTIGFLRRASVTAGNIPDRQLDHAAVVLHLSSETPEPLDQFRTQLARLVGPAHRPTTLAGVVRPLRYTGNAMHNFAYAHRIVQQSGAVMPAAFLMPLSKTAAWWKKDWMERHTFFLPRYDESGRMVSQGHALAAAAGISCLMRRTYWNAQEPAPAGEYDFINYFECSDEDVATFREICGALRDTKRNPEWTFVREGPTWHGRRVPQWEDLFR
ncbi:MAG TPA: hypothetical protein VKE96_15520 [Vicinamibacterales bacterium]|nr:hypothetical protein [Vicinamibacterales bacterium]